MPTVWSDEIPGVVIDAAFWWIGVEGPGTPVEKIGDLSLEVSYKLRTLAILELLGHASTDGFVHGCTRAARARSLYLRRLADAGIDRAHHRSPAAQTNPRRNCGGRHATGA